MMMMVWAADYPDGDSFMGLFESNTGNNLTHYSDAKFDENIKSSGREALSRYELKIKTLTEAKEKLLREYDAEIGTYQAIVKEMKGGTK